MKKLLLIIMLLLLSTAVFGRSMQIDTINPCYGDVLIKVYDNDETNYTIEGLELNNQTLWQGSCDGEFKIIFNVNNDSKASYSFDVEHLISPPEEGSSDLIDLLNDKKKVLDKYRDESVALPQDKHNYGLDALMFFMTAVGILLVLCLLGFLWYIGRRAYLKSKESEDDDESLEDLMKDL